jgi:hypothetical protein
MGQSIQVDPSQFAYNQQCPPYYYSMENADFYGSDYQPNYASTTNSNSLIETSVTEQNLISQTLNSIGSAYEPQIDVKSEAPTSFVGYKNEVKNSVETSTPNSSDYSSPGCSTSPGSTASLSSVSSSVAASKLPPEIAAKVFCPPSALNPSGHQRTPRRNKFELNAKRVHYCTEPGKFDTTHQFWKKNQTNTLMKMIHLQKNLKNDSNMSDI